MVSVIVPVYNAAAYLAPCVDSVLAQSMEDWELILVDDGSTDESPALCDAYAAKDARVRVLHRAPGGVADAVAAGIEAAQGDILGFVDADDWVDPDWFAELLHALETHGADIIEGQFVNEIFSGDTQRTMGSRRTGVTCWEGLEDLKRLAEEYMLSFRYDGVPDKPDRPLTYAKWDKLYRRDLLQKALPWYDGRLSLGEDAVLNAAAVSLAEKVVTAPTTAKYHHRILSGSVSHRSGEEELARIGAVYEALRKVAEDFNMDKNAVLAFVGSMVHARVYRAAGRADLSMAQRRALVKNFHDGAPAGALTRYAAARGDMATRVFYRLLDMGFTGLCVRIAAAMAGKGAGA